jgi:hypothetical protein
MLHLFEEDLPSSDDDNQAPSDSAGRKLFLVTYEYNDNRHAPFVLQRRTFPRQQISNGSRCAMLSLISNLHT